MNRKKTIFFFLSIVVLLGAYFFSQLQFSPQFSPFGLASNAEKSLYETIDARFEKEVGGAVYILEKPDKWNTYEDFKTLENISEKAEKLIGTKVNSLSNLTMPAKRLIGYSNRKILKLKSKSIFEKSYAKLNKMDFVISKFISEDGRYTLLFIKNIKDLGDLKIGLLNDLFGDTCKGYLYSRSSQSSEKGDLISESIWIGLMALFLILLGFYFMTKSLKGLPLIGLVISFNLAVVFLFMFVTGIAFSMNMIAVPCLLVVLSFSDILHIFYFQARHANEFENDIDLRKNMLAKIGWPMILTSISNLLGFIVFFLLSENEMLTELSIVSIFGVVVAYFSSRFIVVPLIDKQTIYIKKKNISGFNDLFLPITRFVQSYRRVVIPLTIILFLGGAFSLYSGFSVDLKVENYISSTSNNFKASNILNKHFFGSKSGEILIDLADEDEVWTYTHQKKIDEIENEIKDIFNPKFLTSSNGLIKRFNQISVNGNPNAYRLVKELRTDEISPFINSLGGKQIVSKDRRSIRIKWGFIDDGIPVNLSKFKSLKAKLASLNSGLNYQVIGKSLLADESVVYYSKRLIWGLLIAVFLSSIIIFTYLKSFRLAFGAILVNGIPILICMLLMLVSDVQINPQSLFLLGVLTGLCLDDSIYLLGYRTKSINDLVLFPISTTSIVLGLAFLSMSFSSYPWLKDFSGIFVVGLALAFILDVFILPLFMKLLLKTNGE